MDILTKDFYNSNAQNLIKRYNSVTPEYRRWFKKLFIEGAKVLDLGCGSGRDIRTLVELGIDAYGIEPSDGFIKYSADNLRSRIFEGNLPDDLPDNILQTRWDGILIIAVFQHLTEYDVSKTVNTINNLIKYSGNLIISVPVNYPEIRNNRDQDNRLFILRPVEYYVNLFNKAGFNVVNILKSKDALKRDKISWVTLVFQKFN